MLGLGTPAMSCRSSLERPNEECIDITYDQVRLGWPDLRSDRSILCEAEPRGDRWIAIMRCPAPHELDGAIHVVIDQRIG